MPHGGLYLCQVEVRVFVGGEVYIAVVLGKSLHDDVREVSISDRFFHSGQLPAQAIGLDDVRVRILVRFHAFCGQFRLKHSYRLVGNAQVLVLQFFHSLLPVTTGAALVVSVSRHKESHCLVSDQVQDCVEVHVGSIERGLALRQGTSCSVQQAGSQQRCCAAVLFFICAAFILGWPSLAFHRSECVGALHAEDKSSLPTPITKSFGVLPGVALDPSHRVDEVTVGVADARGASMFSAGSPPMTMFSHDVGVVVPPSSSSRR